MQPALAPVEPAAPTPSGAEAPPPLQVHAWSLPLRLLGTLALLVHVLNVLHLVALVLEGTFDGVLRAPPPFIALRLAVLSLLPLALVRLLRWWGTASVHLEPQGLVLRHRRVRYEIPSSALDSVRPWRLPWPVAGFSLRLKSGRTFRYALESAQPAALLEALEPSVPQASRAASHPGTRFAQARAAVRRSPWRLAFKYGLFPLLPTLIHFRAHQHIAYGGTFGQYHLLGLEAYLKTLLGIWLLTLTHLLLYAALWRGLAGALALGGTWVAPSRAGGVRRFAEWTCALAFYVGLPVLVALPFLL